MKHTIDSRCSYTEIVPTKSLKPHPKNPNKHSAEQIDRLAKLLEYQGFRHPIIVSKLSGYIVAGHGRLAAAKKLKMDAVPVDYQEFESEDSEYAFLVSDNAIASWAELDLSGINTEIGALGPDFDIDLLGLNGFTIDPSEDKTQDDADSEEVSQEPAAEEPEKLFGQVQLFNGDCLEILASVEKNTFDAIVTDPPYGLSFMGKKWDYDVPSKEIWMEALRVLKPGGHLLAFGGTRTYHRLVVAIEDAGFEIRDQVQWIYGQGFPKSLSIEKAGGGPQSAGQGTALKPANEPICLARKPLDKGLTVAANVMKWGTGGLNIDGARIPAADQAVLDAAVKRMTGNNAVGWKNTSTEGIKPNSAQGRFPANVILDEAAGELLDLQTGKLGTSFRANGSTVPIDGNGNPFKDKGRGAILYADKGGASRFFYCAKASTSERNAGCEGMPDKEILLGHNQAAIPKMTKDGQPNHTIKSKNFHPTVKPVSLMRYLCNLVVAPGGIVLDLFMGSGTTGVGALQSGVKFVGIEREKQYFEICKKRLNYEKNKSKFDGVQ